MICKACGKEFKLITNSHLRKEHGITPGKYLELFPGSQFSDDPGKPRRHKSRPMCNRPGCDQQVTQTWNKYCSYHCSMSHRMSKSGRNEQAGLNNSQATTGWYSLGKLRKSEARDRDQNICQRCKTLVVGKAAHVHHRIPERCFDTANKAHDLKNLVTLCDKCHLVVEWGMVRELYQRAKKLDQLLSGVFGWVTSEEFFDSLLQKAV